MLKNEDIKEIENTRNDKDTYIIRWQMTTLCNYYCDFCIQGNAKMHALESKGESSKIRTKIVENLIQFIEKELNGKYKILKIYLIGGEVTILKDFKEILKKLVKIKFKGEVNYHITTNLSADKEDLLEITNMFKGKHHKILWLSASFYKEFTTEEEFMDKIKLIHNPHKKVNRMVMEYKKYKEKGFKNKVKYMISIVLEKFNRTMFLSICYPLMNDEDYFKYQNFRKRNLRYVDKIEYIVIRRYKKELTKELKEKLKRESHKAIKLTTFTGDEQYFKRTDDISINVEGGFNPRGMLCDSGVNCISIDNLGVISRCVSCQKMSIVGNIIEGNFKPLTKEFICPNDTCSCNYYKVIKRKD